MSECGQKRKLCGHCNEYLSKTAFFNHKRLHFDKRTNEWQKDRVYYDADSSESMDQEAFRPVSYEQEASLTEATLSPLRGPEQDFSLAEGVSSAESSEADDDTFQVRGMSI